MFNGYIICAFVMFLGILFYSRKEAIQRKRKKFNRIFNVEAPRSFNEKSITSLQLQSKVNEKLRELAAELRNAYSNKEAETKKDEFCKANNLAQRFGFRVRGSPNLYLSQ